MDYIKEGTDMKETLKKISDVFKLIFGYGIMIVLFAGGLTFFGYVIALIIPCTVLVIKFILILPCIDKTLMRIRQGWERNPKYSESALNGKQIFKAKFNSPGLLN